MVDPGVSVDRTRAAFVRASQIGPYFAVGASGAAGWRPVRDLVEHEDVVRERVEVARRVLSQRTGGDVEVRACASITSLGFVSRLVAPALATACVERIVPDLDPDTVFWQPVDGGPVPIAIADVGGHRAETPDAAADALVTGVLEPLVRPVADAYRRHFRLSPRTLWGNVASALGGAAGMLPADTLLDPRDVVAALLCREPLAGAGRYEAFAGHRFFVRHNCCLFYRVPAAGTCGDCVLVPEAARREMWRAAVG